MKSRQPSIIAAGLALFSMFFGAGNVVFPVLLGEQSGSHVWLATISFSIAAVIFPLLGLLAMLLYDCDIKSFFSRLGKGPGMALYSLIVLLLGPLGSTPRLFSVAHATLAPYLWNIGLPLFSLLTAFLLAPFVLKSHQIMRILGYVLTPILLCSLAVIIFRGVSHPPEVLPELHSSGFVLVESLQQGYLLLDLPAALLYAGLVLFYFKRKEDGANYQQLMLRRALQASALALVLLCLTYGGLIFVGAYHASSVQGGGAPEEVLRRVCMSFLGGIGGPLASVAVGMACLTTAISQTIVCTQFLKTNLFKGRGGEVLPMSLTLATAVGMSLIGFSGLMRLLGPILTVLTPALVVLCLANIGHRLYQFKPIKIPVATTLAVTLTYGGIRLFIT